MVALMSHFPMKGQSFARFSLFRFFSLYCLFFAMIFFLFNWLVSFLRLLLPLLFLSTFSPLLFFSSYVPPLPEKKTQRGSSCRSSFFILPRVVFRTHLFLSSPLSSVVSLPPSFSLLHIPLLSLSPHPIPSFYVPFPFRKKRSAVVL